MTIIYIADDGTHFDNEWDCEAYEWKLNHQHIKDILAFDKDGNKFEDMMAEDTYNYSTKIVITSDAALQAIRDLASYTGYCEYESIDSIGEWIHDDRKNCFVKEK